MTWSLTTSLGNHYGWYLEGVRTAMTFRSAQGNNQASGLYHNQDRFEADSPKLE